jgi:RNA polymerase sigma factor (sigma-70 family)
MANGHTGIFLRQLNRLRLGPAAGLSDKQLLNRFARDRSEEAFAILVERHGPLVLGLCRRVLRHEQDAEDAFQATFLVLARKAGAIRWRETVGGWLYAVAQRVAAKAHSTRFRDCEVDTDSFPENAREPSEATAHRELLTILDDELLQLPPRYRAPLILCYLEGKSHTEAAAELGWPVGTVKGRIARAKEHLRVRLTRRGVALSVSVLAMEALPESIAAVPLRLAGTTVRVAGLFAAVDGAAAGMLPGHVAELAQAVSNSLTTVKLKLTVAFLLLASTFTASAGMLIRPVPRITQPPCGLASMQPTRLSDQPKPDSAPTKLDLYGDPLPPGAAVRLGTVRWRHGDVIRHLAFSPSGKALAAGSDSSVHIWDPASGRESLCIRPKPYGIVTAVAYSVDGRLIAIGHNCDQPRCLLWDASTGQAVNVVPDQAHCYGLAFSPDGKLFGTVDGETLRLWNLATGLELRMVELKGASLQRIVFARDGKQLAVADFTGNVVRIFEVESLKETGTLRGHKYYVNGLAFAPDGKKLASADDATLRIWDMTTSQEERRITGHERAVEGVAYSPDGKMLASVGADQRVRVWDPSKGAELHSIDTPGIQGSVTFSPDGKALASGGLAIRLFDTSTYADLRPSSAPTDRLWRALYTHDGKSVITTDGRWLRTWDPATGKEKNRRTKEIGQGEDPFRLMSIAMTNDDRLLAMVSARDGGPITISELVSGKELCEPKGHVGPVTGLAFSPAGQRLYSAGMDTTIREWDVATGLEARRFLPQASSVWSLALSPDGKVLVTASIGQPNVESTEIRLWSTDSGKPIDLIENQSWCQGILRFSPDGRLVVGLGSVNNGKGYDSQFRCWDVATKKEINRLTVPGTTEKNFAVSSDGRTLALALWNRVSLWEVASGKERHGFEGHLGQVHFIAFSPDSKHLVTSSSDTTALIWDLTLGTAGKMLTRGDAEALWTDLAGDNAENAYVAIQRLAADPKSAVPFLHQRLQPVGLADPKKLTKLIGDLDSATFTERENAHRELASLGDAAASAIRKALAGTPTLEARRRMEELLKKLEPAASPDGIRRLRAVEVLEGIGTPEARQVLQFLAEGIPEAWLTREAKASLDRFAKRPVGK